MKQITAVLSLLFLFACAKKSESKLFLPIEYEFPEMKAGESKTYVYVDRDSPDSTFCNYDVYSKDGHNLLIASFYSGKITEDSLLYLDGRLEEAYASFFNKVNLGKADILTDTVVETGRRYGKQILEENFSSDSLINFVRHESEFMKDTVFVWKGVRYPTIVTKTTASLRIKSKILPKLRNDFEVQYLIYQGEHIGALRITFLNMKDNKTKTLDLVEIR